MNGETLSDESYNNILSFQQRNDSEPEGDRANLEDETDSDDDSDIELQPKIIKQKKAKNATVTTRRSTRARVASLRAKISTYFRTSVTLVNGPEHLTNKDNLRDSYLCMCS
jgi:hypothetical protein